MNNFAHPCTEVETQSVNEITITAAEYVKFTIDGVEYGGDVGFQNLMNVGNIKLAKEKVFTDSYGVKCRTRYHK